MKKILLSLAIVLVVATAVAGGTLSFFSDTETSTGNTFTAGAVDLTVDSTQYYNGYACQNGIWINVYNPDHPQYPAGLPCDPASGNWQATDLGAEHQFFNFSDLKPGDSGVTGISLHVDNDAWMRLVIKDINDLDNSCTEPEEESSDSCTVVLPELQTPGAGELRENLQFSFWLDEGETPGFQGLSDPGEGDTILNYDEPYILDQTISGSGVAYNLSDYLLYPYLVGGQTAYLGIWWYLPLETGNEVQTDSMNATVEFQVEQHRNNPTPSFGA